MATSASYEEMDEMEMEVDEPTEDKIITPSEKKSLRIEEAVGMKNRYLDEGDPNIKRVCVDVEWPDQKMPNKGELLLEKALQTFFNKTCNNQCTVNSVRIMDNQSSAEVEITPASALEKLLEIKTGDLKFKDFKTPVKVHFSSVTSSPLDPPKTLSMGRYQKNVPVYFTAQVDLTDISPEVQSFLRKKYFKNQIQDGCLSISGSFEEIENIYHDLCALSEAKSQQIDPRLKKASHSSRPDQEENHLTPVASLLPLFHCFYVSNVCSKEIEYIQNRFGVRFQSSVSVRDCKENHTAEQALQEFTDLVQKALPINTINLEPGSLEEVLKEVQRENLRLQLSVSAQGCQLSGPTETVDRFQRKAPILSGMLPVYEQKSQDGLSETLLSDFSQSSLAEGVHMSSLHWSFIQHVFAKQLEAIERKFGVFFKENHPSGNITLSASGSQEPALLFHAHHALMDLYQKTATSLISCTLKNPNQEQMVLDVLENIPHLDVTTEKLHGTWRLTGLQEDLGPVVEQIEKKLGGPVFNEKDKLQLNTGDIITNAQQAAGGQAAVQQEECCPICIDTFTNKTRLDCKHEFCSKCLDRSVEALGPQCPVCKKIFGNIKGDQPNGQMIYNVIPTSLPGFQNCGTIEICYKIPSGVQTEKHPHPGRPFSGTSRLAYLPNNREGNDVLKLLKRAFDQRLIFTVGVSRTTGATDTVTWNDIHHKTSMMGGPSCFGYPDPDYLKRVKEELKAKGIE